jgi:hypothetical protein
MKRLLVLASVLVGFATPALASQCPTYMQKVDASLTANQDLRPGQIEDAKKHRKDGEAAHNAGNHEKSIAELKKASEALGIQE